MPQRFSRLSEALLRISASLDLDTVLREVVESARALTGARYGVITTLDDAGQAQDFVTSGFTPDEHRELAGWSDGPRLFEHFRDLPAPVRLADLPAYVRGLGFSSDLMPSKTFQGTPMRHCDVHVGNFFLAGKEGGREFTGEDEDILALFASQAATAIANARMHRDERRARADLGHELLAPLTSIKGSAATALHASPALKPAETRQYLRIIDEQADRMRGLIGDLLDAGRIETGTLSVDVESSEVAVLVDQARNTFLSAGGRQAVHIDLPLDLPRVMADRQRIVQVLNNLFSNASRSSPGSSPIRVAAVKDGVHVAISVSDQGRGVPAAELSRLFRKHAGLAGGHREPGAGGYGLGLAICKGIVEAHGGRIWAESGGAAAGTRLTFTIPVAEEAAGGVATRPRENRSRSPRQTGEQPRILVVDDDPQTLRYVRDALVPAGYTPVVTADPRDLPRLVSTQKPRLVLLDLILPGTDGIELMQQVPELADVPIIFISAYGRDETIVKALDSGAADYIVKPFSPSELTARVRAALRRRAGTEPFLLRELAIRYEERRVTVAGRTLELTATEFELLRVLSLNAGRVLTYRFLLRAAWRGRGRGSGDARPVHAAVKRLRRKLGDDAARPTYILNERAVGYRMPWPGDA